MSTAVLLTNGILKAVIYAIGCGFAVHRKRGMLAGAFGLAAYVSTIRAFDDANGPHSTTLDTAAALGTIVAVLLVGSFVAVQPRGGRPRRWTP